MQLGEATTLLIKNFKIPGEAPAVNFGSRFSPVRGGANSESRGQFKLAPQSRGQRRAPLFFLPCLFPVGKAVRDLLLIVAAVQLRSASDEKTLLPKIWVRWDRLEIKVFNQEGCQETYHAVSMISRVNATAPSKDYANHFFTARLELSFLADHPLD